MTPVVRWTDSICYLEKDPINGTNNIFEYFYLPVSDISGEEVSKCKMLFLVLLNNHLVYQVENSRGMDIEKEWN